MTTSPVITITTIYDSKTRDNDDQVGGRLALRWTPTDTFSMTGTYLVDETDQDGWYRSSGDNWQEHDQANRMEEVLTADAEILSLNMEWDVGWADITSATAQLNFDSFRKVDRTFLGIDAFYDPARLAVLDDTRDEAFSQELRIVSDPESFGNFEWVAGMYFSDAEVNVDVGDYIGIGDGYDQNDSGDIFAAAAPIQDFVFPFPVGYVSPFGLSEVPWHLSGYDLSASKAYLIRSSWRFLEKSATTLQIAGRVQLVTGIPRRTQTEALLIRSQMRVNQCSQRMLLPTHSQNPMTITWVTCPFK